MHARGMQPENKKGKAEQGAAACRARPADAPHGVVRCYIAGWRRPRSRSEEKSWMPPRLPRMPCLPLLPCASARLPAPCGAGPAKSGGEGAKRDRGGGGGGGGVGEGGELVGGGRAGRGGGPPSFGGSCRRGARRPKKP